MSNKKEQQDQICSICNQIPNKPVGPNCGHLFCLACLTKVAQSIPKCPTCRFPIFKSENFREKVKPSKVTMEDSRIENKSIENKKFLLFYTNSYIMPENHQRVNIIADYLLPIPLPQLASFILSAEIVLIQTQKNDKKKSKNQKKKDSEKLVNLQIFILIQIGFRACVNGIQVLNGNITLDFNTSQRIFVDEITQSDFQILIPPPDSSPFYQNPIEHQDSNQPSILKDQNLDKLNVKQQNQQQKIYDQNDSEDKLFQEKDDDSENENDNLIDKIQQSSQLADKQDKQQEQLLEEKVLLSESKNKLIEIKDQSIQKIKKEKKLEESKPLEFQLQYCSGQPMLDEVLDLSDNETKEYIQYLLENICGFLKKQIQQIKDEQEQNKFSSDEKVKSGVSLLKSLKHMGFKIQLIDLYRVFDFLEPDQINSVELQKKFSFLLPGILKLPDKIKDEIALAPNFIERLMIIDKYIKRLESSFEFLSIFDNFPSSLTNLSIGNTILIIGIILIVSAIIGWKII